MKIVSVRTTQAVAGALIVALGIVAGVGKVTAQEKTPPTITETNPAVANQDLVRAYLAIQEQLHETQLALERNRQEAEVAAGRNAVAMSRRLNVIERFMAQQREEESRTIRLIALSVAGAGLLAALLVTLAQMRAMRQMTLMAQALPAQHMLQLAAGPEAARLIGGGTPEATTRLKDTIERLQKQIHELETRSTDSSRSNVADKGGLADKTEALLTKGQELLGLGKAADAARVFDEALGLSPNHAGALVKKGSALEKLAKWDEAIACYDRAIAADSSLTIAYLNKGGVLNRRQRYEEALVCYEEALKVQDKAHGP